MNIRNEELYNNILETASNRRTAKQYDTTKDVDQDTLSKIYSFTKTSPSSVGLELTRIVSINRDSVHKKGVVEFLKSFNQERSFMASNLTILVTKTEEFFNVENELLNSRAKRIVIAGKESRGEEYSEGDEKGLVSVLVSDDHANNGNNLEEWTARQAYIQCGLLVIGAATLGVESTIMEGFTPGLTNYLRENNIIAQDERATLAIALGYVSEENKGTFIGEKQLRISDDEYIKYH